MPPRPSRNKPTSTDDNPRSDTEVSQHNSPNGETSSSPNQSPATTIPGHEMSALAKRMIKSRDDLCVTTFYLGDSNADIASKTVWMRDPNGNDEILVTKSSFDAQKKAIAAQEKSDDDDIPIPPCEPALLSIVIHLSSEDFYMFNPMAVFEIKDPKHWKSNIHKATMINALGVQPSLTPFKDDFKRAMTLIRQLVDSCARMGNERTGFVTSTASGIKDQLKFRHTLIKPLEAKDDAKHDFLPGVTIANWPDCTLDARNELAAIANKFYCDPLPVYDRGGNKIHPNQYKDLKGSMVQVKFNLVHYTIGGPGKKRNDAYVTDILEMRVLKAPVSGGIKRKMGSVDTLDDRKQKKVEL